MLGITGADTDAVDRKRAFLLAIGCATALAAPACAAPSPARIAPAALVLPRAALPGFGAAKVKLVSTTSAAGYGGKLKAAALEHDGFAQGALETFQMARDAFAASWAAVFRTATGARHAFAAESVEFSGTPSPAGAGKHSTEQTFTVKAIPGAVGRKQTLSVPGGHLYEVEVSFTTGRCLLNLTIGRFSPKPSLSMRQLEGAANAGAGALDRHVSRTCG
jgi:hypothetical protein